MLNLIKRHTLTFIVGVIFIAVITVLFLVTDYRELGYICFNGSILTPIGLFIALMVIIREDDKKEK